MTKPKRPQRLTPKDTPDQLWSSEVDAAEYIINWFDTFRKLCQLSHTPQLAEDVLKVMRNIDADTLFRVKMKLMDMLYMRFALGKDDIQTRENLRTLGPKAAAEQRINEAEEQRKNFDEEVRKIRRSHPDMGAQRITNILMGDNATNTVISPYKTDTTLTYVKQVLGQKKPKRRTGQ